MLLPATEHSHLVLYNAPVILLALALAAAALKLYHVLSNPLNRIPGPAIAQWTNLKLKKEALTGEQPRYVNALHKKYGPIVRIAPDTVSLADAEAARTIYKVGGRYLKSAFYDGFGPKSHSAVKSVFTMRDFKAHGKHRQLTASFFSEKYVAQMEPYIIANINLAVKRMREEVDAKGFVDVFKWFFFMATDVIGDAAFGESFHMLESGKVNQYIEDLQQAGESAVFRAELPTLVNLLSYIPTKTQKNMGRVFQRLFSSGQESVNRYWKALRADPDNVKPTLLTKEYGMVEEGSLHRDQLTRDAMGYLVAGTDTTSNTLTYTLWELAHHPEVEKELIREVATLDEGYTDVDLRRLKYLDGVINEGLRLHPAVPGALPRSVPLEGAEFCGHYLPGGTVVGIQALTMQRDASVWEDAERFDPTRWLDVSDLQKSHFLAFGGGSRICMGMHFARLEMRHTVAAFYRTFTRGVCPSDAEGFSDRDMLPAAFFLEGPAGKRCLLQRRS